jgi:hypothetical protein
MGEERMILPLLICFTTLHSHTYKFSVEHPYITAYRSIRQHVSAYYKSSSGLLFQEQFKRNFVGRDSSVGLVTGYRLDGPGIESR